MQEDTVSKSVGLSGKWRHLLVPVEFYTIARTNPQVINQYNTRSFLRELTLALTEGRIFVVPRHIMAAVTRDVDEKTELIARRVAREETNKRLFELGFALDAYDA